MGGLMEKHFGLARVHLFETFVDEYVDGCVRLFGWCEREGGVADVLR